MEKEKKGGGKVGGMNDAEKEKLGTRMGGRGRE